MPHRVKSFQESVLILNYSCYACFKKDLLDIALHIAEENNFKKIDINFAQRGDILYYKDEFDWDGTLGVCIGSQTMFNWKKGMTIIPNTECEIAWRIE